MEGERYAGALHQDESYTRLARTIDLSSVTAAQAPALEFALSFSTEVGYDHVIIEAAPTGTDNWTTLPDLNGGTSNAPPTQCEDEFLLDMHPWLTHYLTLAQPLCGTTGTTGQWNSFTGNSGGWTNVRADLAAYAGGSVDVKISYVTDPGTGGVGVFVDDTRVTTTAGTLDADGFETDPSLWTVEGSPPGSEPTVAEFVISTTLVDVAAGVATDDTVLFGFGIEQLATAAEQADALGRALDHLLA